MSTHSLRTVFPPGHFHSPIVDPEKVGDYHRQSVAKEPEQIEGIRLSLDAMAGFWNDHIDLIRSADFPAARTADRRYHHEGGPFPYGDAVILRAMLGMARPRRIIEIGSGFSTACMLDAADEFRLRDLDLTCIEPHTERLASLLRPDDLARVTIVRDLVQHVAAADFTRLDENNILFIDSTHVLKTGSDVHYEFFEILPILRPGVLVHFHDCQYPFEYPAKWVFDTNFSWNEIYALRAFLMYNDRFDIVFWSSFFRRKCIDLIAESFPEFLPHNPGSSIWLRVHG